VNRDVDESSASAVHVFCTTTLSKAVGGHGGLIAGSEKFIDRVRTASGWFRGASAPVSAVAAASAKGIQWIREHPELRTQLVANVARARAGLAGLGLDVEMSPSPIIGFKLDSTSRMERVHRTLLDEHIAIGFARDYPGAGLDGMLRIAIFATHSAAMIDRLLDAMRRAVIGE
jgi:7-keto-8-aminopelargonate synthetase-like enzyme